MSILAFEAVDKALAVEAEELIALVVLNESCDTETEHGVLAKAHSGRHPYWHPCDSRQLR